VADSPNDGESAPHAAIVGGGLAGLCAGLALAQMLIFGQQPITGD
jgi:cation diffusion facilitator CzcD-associated flavoprotein CzcO